MLRAPRSHVGPRFRGIVAEAARDPGSGGGVAVSAHVEVASGPRGTTIRGIVAEAARDPGSGGAAAVSAHVEVASLPRGTTIPRNRGRGRAGPRPWRRCCG